MKRKITVITLCALLVALCFFATAQQTGKVYRYLTNASEIRKDSEETFRNALRERGESFDEQPFREFDSEAPDFRAAFELFAPVRRLG